MIDTCWYAESSDIFVNWKNLNRVKPVLGSFSAHQNFINCLPVILSLVVIQEYLIQISSAFSSSANILKCR